jgi:hypothetical protein
MLIKFYSLNNRASLIKPLIAYTRMMRFGEICCYESFGSKPFQHSGNFGKETQSHNSGWVVLYFVMDCFARGGSVSTVHVVEQQFTSRSSTYRKLSDLREMGLVMEQWNDGVCMVLPGPKMDQFIADLGTEASHNKA